MDINSKRLTNYLFDFVQIDSESGDEKKFRKHLINLANSLGFKNTWEDEFGNLYIRIPGKGKKLMINTHLDTVNGKNIKPKISRIKGLDYITSDGTTILGADPKATIAAIFEVMTLFQNKSQTNQDIILTFTCNEESGEPSAKHLICQADYCIVPDRGTPLGEIILKSPDAKVFSVNIKGKTAYATTNYNNGIDAIKASTELLKKMKVGNISEDTVCNIGIIKGGTMPSMVCDHVEIKGSCYSFNLDESNTYFSELKEITSSIDENYRTSTNINFHEHFPGFILNKKHSVVKLADNAIRESGITPVYKEYLAVSNANLINALDIPTVLISYGVENQHSTDERISVDNLYKLTKIIYNIFRYN